MIRCYNLILPEVGSLGGAIDGRVLPGKLWGGELLGALGGGDSSSSSSSRKSLGGGPMEGRPDSEILGGAAKEKTISMECYTYESQLAEKLTIHFILFTWSKASFIIIIRWIVYICQDKHPMPWINYKLVRQHNINKAILNCIYHQEEVRLHRSHLASLKHPNNSCSSNNILKELFTSLPQIRRHLEGDL